MRTAVAVDGAKGRERGKGIFRRLLEERFPLLAAEDEVRMRIPDVRSHFIVRLFVLARWKDAIDKGVETADLLDFHGRQRSSGLSQSRSQFREMEHLIEGVRRTGAGLRQITAICSWALWQSVQAGQGTQPRCAGHRHN